MDIARAHECIDNILCHVSLANADGCHVHFWLPKDFTKEQLKRLKRKAKFLWDVVSFSYEKEPRKYPEVIIKNPCKLSWPCHEGKECSCDNNV